MSIVGLDGGGGTFCYHQLRALSTWRNSRKLDSYSRRTEKQSTVPRVRMGVVSLDRDDIFCCLDGTKKGKNERMIRQISPCRLPSFFSISINPLRIYIQHNSNELCGNYEYHGIVQFFKYDARSWSIFGPTADRG